MITISKIKSLFKNGNKDVPTNPTRDWLILLVCATIAFAGIVVWNAWAFDTITRGEAIGSSIATSTTAVFDNSSMNTIHSVFKERAYEEAKYRTGVYRYADPSQ